MKFNAASRRASKILYAAEHDAKHGLATNVVFARGRGAKSARNRRTARSVASYECYFEAETARSAARSRTRYVLFLRRGRLRILQL